MLSLQGPRGCVLAVQAAAGWYRPVRCRVGLSLSLFEVDCIFMAVLRAVEAHNCCCCGSNQHLP